MIISRTLHLSQPCNAIMRLSMSPSTHPYLHITYLVLIQTSLVHENPQYLIAAAALAEAALHHLISAPQFSLLYTQVLKYLYKHTISCTCTLSYREYLPVNTIYITPTQYLSLPLPLIPCVTLSNLPCT